MMHRKDSGVNADDVDASKALVQETEKLQITTLNKTTTINMDSQISTPFGSNHALITPPSTPKSEETPAQFPQLQSRTPSIRTSAPTLHRRRSSTDPSTFMDVSNISLDTNHAQLLGTGLWSKVYKLTPFVPSSLPMVPEAKASRDVSAGLCTPPSSPPTTRCFLIPQPQTFAMKVATRPDAIPVFEHEAAVLKHLQTRASGAPDYTAEQHVIPFHGFSAKSQALIFHCANAGSLDQLIATSSSRSPFDRLHLFETIAPQLVAALAFIHAKGVVHADIKPANILLSTDGPEGSLRARFADFGASFIAEHADDLPKSAAGGTWEYMAPEQLVRDVTISKPSFASDVYSLGVTLLELLGGGSCFSEVSNNLFMLREAVKVGDVIDFATRSWLFQRSIEETEREWKYQGGDVSLLQLLKGALRKKKEDRLIAGLWVEVLGQAGLGHS